MATSSSSTVSFLAMAVVAMAALQAAAANNPPPPPPTTPYGRPTNCAATLIQLSSCAPFLTLGNDISGPPASCCAPLRAFLGNPASICLCHAIGGQSQINELFGINIDPIRLALLPIACWAIVPPQLPGMCFVGPVPPLFPIPPIAMLPSPPVMPPSPPVSPLP